MAKDDLVYLVRRAAEERMRASIAKHDGARVSHAGLADAYEARLRVEVDIPAAKRSG
jgi:hypothetical protein